MSVFFNNGTNNTNNPNAIFTQGSPTYVTPQMQPQMQQQLPLVGPNGMPLPMDQQQLANMGTRPYQPQFPQQAISVKFKISVSCLTAVENVDKYISQLKDILAAKGRSPAWTLNVEKVNKYTANCPNGKKVTFEGYWVVHVTNVSVTDLLEAYPSLKNFSDNNDLQLQVFEKVFNSQVEVNMMAKDVIAALSDYNEEVVANTINVGNQQKPVEGPLDGMTLKNVKTVKRPIKGTDMVEITKTEYEVEMSRNTPSIEEVKQALKP